ncbi:MAG TPA: PKD domain-containing protein [Bacteroidia bacterium]|nr:PKD domain-containing protein [Bacteroidia bacterium]
MKKITKKINIKKMLGVAVLCLGLNQITVAQCGFNASFTYTVGSSGLVNFTNTSTGSGTIVYNWHFSDGTNSTVTSPTHTFQYNGAYNVNLLMRDTLGNCFDSTSQIINITTGITCSIAPSFSYSAGSGGQLNFTNTSTNVPSNAVYSWGFGDGSGSNQASPSHTYFYNGSYTVNLYVADSNGFCTNSTAQTVTVTNGNTCNLSVNFTYTLGTNGQIIFTNTTTGADTNGVIHWNFGDGSYVQSPSSPSHTFQYNGTYYVSLQMGDSLSPCHGNHMDTITITNATNAPVCGAGFTDSVQVTAGTINFMNQSWGTSGTTIYSWSFGDGSSSNLQSPSHTYAYNGVYSVTLSISDSANSCSSSVTNSVNITNTGTVSCVASVTFNMHQDSLNTPGVWQAATIYSSQVTSAVWNWGDGTSSTGLYPSHTYTAAGHYNICVMAFASCGDSSIICQNDSLYRANGTNSIISVTAINAGVAGIKAITKENTQVSIYPNPSAGVFTLSLTNIAATTAQINVTNILGEVIYSTQEQVSNGTIAKQIDLANTANGAYFMKVIVGSQAYTSKLIINK